MSRLEKLKRELEIIRTMECMSFDHKAIVIARYEKEISVIEEYGEMTLNMKGRRLDVRNSLEEAN